MEPNTLYFFSYSGEKDNTEFVKKINCNDVIWADIVETVGLKMKTRFAFRLELKDKVHIFLENSAINVNNWLRAVKTAKRCEQERNRTSSEELHENVDFLYWYYRRKQNNEIMQYCQEQFNKYFIYDTSNPDSRFDEFIKAANSSHDNFKNVIKDKLDTRCPTSMQTLLYRAVPVGSQLLPQRLDVRSPRRVL